MGSHKLDFANFSDWIVKASYLSCVCVLHNSFFKHKISTFALKHFQVQFFSSVLDASKVCHDVPIIHT
jgi:hypothetical protein